MLSRIASAVRVSASRRARAPLSQARFLSSAADESLEDFVARAMGDAGFSDGDAAEVTASLRGEGVINLGVMERLNESDWANSKISTGAARILQDAVAARLSDQGIASINRSKKIKRSLSQSSQSKRMQL